MSVDELRKTYSRGIPLGREAKLSEVASVIAFLVRRRAEGRDATGAGEAGRRPTQPSTATSRQSKAKEEQAIVVTRAALIIHFALKCCCPAPRTQVSPRSSYLTGTVVNVSGGKSRG